MVCIYCGGATKVINSRHQKHTNGVWRRRQCLVCHALFTSIEQVSHEQSLAVQNDASHILPFDRDRLFLSIYGACRHRNSAIRDAASLTATVIARLTPVIHDGIINSSDIRDAVLVTLKAFDHAASVHYDAYHHQ